VNTFSAGNFKETDQFSQELRVVTNFDGRWNGAFGALYWEENVTNGSTSITAESAGSHCFWNSATWPGQPVNPIGIPDGCSGYTEVPVAPYQNAAQPFRTESPSDRDTEHWSVYGAIDFDLTDTWTLSLEGRYNEEDVEVFGPVFYDPGASGGPGGLNPCGIFFRACEPFEDWLTGTVADPGQWFSDAYFPWTDEDADGNDLLAFVPDQALIDQIPGACWQQNSAAIIDSIEQGPSQIEYTGTQSAITGPDGQTIMVDTPKWDDGQVPIIDQNTGEVVQNAAGTNMFNPWCRDSLSDTDEWFSPKITMDWAISDDASAYFAWSRARKPGGFGLLTVGSSGLNRDVTEFEPERMEVWEVGTKTAWLGNTLIANGAVFFQDFTDKQALTSALGNDGRLVSKTENAGSAEVWGVELSVAWSPASEFLGGDWSLRGSHTWLPKAEYTDFTVESGSSANAAAAGNCTPTLVGTESLCTLSYTGNQLEDAPEHAFVGFIGYTKPLQDGIDAYVETDILWQDKRFTGVTNNLWTDAYWNFDFRLGLRADRWEALFYINNLLDNDTVRMVGGGPGLGCCFVLGSGLDLATPAVPSAAVMVDLPLFSTAFLPPPRVIGARLTYRFGG